MKTFRLMCLVLVVFILGFSCSESGREINSEQLQKRGDDLYYAVNEEKPYSGKVVELYGSGQKRSEISYKNGAIDGQWISWYVNGQKESQGRYKDGKRVGRWDFWTTGGEKLETIPADIDGNRYLTIKIGEQWWMAENLKVVRYRNGDAIPNVTDNGDWSGLTTGAYCSYNDDSANTETYGYLYNWYAINDQRGLAPEGWHIASDGEWQKLVDHLGGNSVAGGKMKETALWASPNTGATNESGLSARPSGYRDDRGSYDLVGHIAGFWSSTENNRASAKLRSLHYDYSDISRDIGNKRIGFSVRCVRD